MELIKLTPKAAIALDFLRGADAPLTGADIAAGTDLNPQGIHGVLNSLVKKGFVAKGDPITLEVANKAGLMEERSYVTYFVTEAGVDYVAAE